MKPTKSFIAIYGINDRHSGIAPRVDKCSSISKLIIKLQCKYLFKRTPSEKVIRKIVREHGFIQLTAINKDSKTTYNI